LVEYINESQKALRMCISVENMKKLKGRKSREKNKKPLNYILKKYLMSNNQKLWNVRK
jgi:hypothetical protein